MLSLSVCGTGAATRASANAGLQASSLTTTIASSSATINASYRTHIATGSLTSVGTPIIAVRFRVAFVGCCTAQQWHIGQCNGSDYWQDAFSRTLEELTPVLKFFATFLFVLHFDEVFRAYRPPKIRRLNLYI